MTFPQFIDQIGAPRLAEILGMSEAIIYRWRSLGSAPRPDIAFKVISLSHGVLDYNKIYGPFVAELLKGTKVHVPTGDGVQMEMNFKD